MDFLLAWPNFWELHWSLRLLLANPPSFPFSITEVRPASVWRLSSPSVTFFCLSFTGFPLNKPLAHLILTRHLLSEKPNTQHTHPFVFFFSDLWKIWDVKMLKPSSTWHMHNQILLYTIMLLHYPWAYFTPYGHCSKSFPILKNLWILFFPPLWFHSPLWEKQATYLEHRLPSPAFLFTSRFLCNYIHYSPLCPRSSKTFSFPKVASCILDLVLF